jgi:hypothetical protein
MSVTREASGSVDVAPRVLRFQEIIRTSAQHNEYELHICITRSYPMISEVPDIVTKTFAPLLEARRIAFD